MFKSCIIFAFLALFACASAKPAVVAYAAPSVVTAQSSQYIARNYNGVAAAPVVAAAYTAPAVAAAPVAAAYTAPVAAPVAAAYSAPVASYASYASYYPYNAAYTVAFCWRMGQMPVERRQKGTRRVVLEQQQPAVVDVVQSRAGEQHWVEQVQQQQHRVVVHDAPVAHRSFPLHRQSCPALDWQQHFAATAAGAEVAATGLGQQLRREQEQQRLQVRLVRQNGLLELQLEQHMKPHMEQQPKTKPFKMFKLFTVCFLALFAVAFGAAKPGLLAAPAALAYSAPVAAAYAAPVAAPLAAAYAAPVAAPLTAAYAAPVAAAYHAGYAGYVAPYASSYSAHSIAHSAAFPAAYAAAPAVAVLRK
ncbi:uncharacterized protein LOC128861145 [Anastrepha ludens]|uniref:uncharacterized protein LOC128861145 n=1 Tax=Anastrepha ludens TaxID=28586 RepID=UPI0023AE94C0|nr:uncharacterized protein LOC128861145 [Anastrepha ludens]